MKISVFATHILSSVYNKTPNLENSSYRLETSGKGIMINLSKMTFDEKAGDENDGE